MKEIKDVAMWEVNDSELVKYHLQQAIDRVKDLKEQIKELFNEHSELQHRINKAIEYCEDIIEQQIDNNDDDFSQGEDFTAREIYKILKGSEEDEN